MTYLVQLSNLIGGTAYVIEKNVFFISKKWVQFYTLQKTLETCASICYSWIGPLVDAHTKLVSDKPEELRQFRDHRWIGKLSARRTQICFDCFCKIDVCPFYFLKQAKTGSQQK